MIKRICKDGFYWLKNKKNKIANMIDTPIVVLLYHRVTSLKIDPHQLLVTPENFKDQLIFIKNHYKVLRFEDDWSSVTEPSVVVTFDDGYADNYHEALPIIEDVGIPATFFVSSGLIEAQQEFWWDAVDYILLGNWEFPDKFRFIDETYGRTWNTGAERDRLVFHKEIIPLMINIDVFRREQWLKQLRDWIEYKEVARDAYRPMSVMELCKFAKSKYVTVGAHTQNHVCLSAISQSRQKEEILKSKQQLEKWINKPVNIFAYPYGGKRHYNRHSINNCKELGFLKAAANFPGQVHRWTDPYQIPRHVVRNCDLATFEMKLREYFYI